MKKSLFLLLLNFLYINAFAQKIIEKKYPYEKGQVVNLNLRFADSIQVRYWDKPEVYVKIKATINGNRLNDALKVIDKKSSSEVGLEINWNEELIRQGKDTDCPNERRGTWTEKDGTKRYLCKTIHYQVMLPRNAQLQMESIDGNIDIDGAAGPVWAKTISGYVDFTWPTDKGANVAMQTITGEVYTDFDITFTNKREKNPIVGYLLEGTLRGGGPAVKLESISNNVYLRSRK